jgi:ribosome-associated heat shock protein Hsp15
MSHDDIIRIDKFLWAVRIYKTRSIASDACKNGRITINNIRVKPSRSIEKSEIIVIKKLPVTYTYKVISPIEKRVSAKLVHDYVEDITPEDEIAKLYIKDIDGFVNRDKGTGRPTKKERRTLDRLKDDFKNG